MPKDHPKSTPAPSPRKKKPLDEAGEGAAPRYLQIARELIAGIKEGRYPVGSHLPTELELCEQLRISRFTARGAVRLLLNGGLVRDVSARHDGRRDSRR